MRLKDKIKTGVETFAHAIAWGMKNADKEILESSSISSEPGISVEKHIVQQGVLNDLLNEQETERVQEFRDKYYRVFVESGNFTGDLKATWNSEEGDWDLSMENMKKNSLEDLRKSHPKIESGEYFELIQPQKVFKDGNMLTAYNKFVEGINDQDTLIDFSYKYRPRFLVDNYLSMLVVKGKTDKDKRELDLYFKFDNSYFEAPYYMFFNRLSECLEKGEKFDFLSPDEISFVTNNAYGEYDLREYRYFNAKFKNITKFKGYYVVHCIADIECEGKDLSEKFKTKGLDEKYKNEAPKGDAIPLDVAIRKFGKE